MDESKNAYYMTSFSIIKNKTKSDYILIFKKLKEHINDFLEIGENYTIAEIHTDFETAIGDTCAHIFPYAKIRYFIWHMKRSINNKKNSICKEIVENNDNYYILYNMINQLYLCKPEFVKIVFNKIKNLIMMILINF